MKITHDYRNSARLIPAKLLGSAWSIVLLLVAAKGWILNLADPWRTMLMVAVAVVVFALVATPIYDVFFHRLVVDPDNRCAVLTRGVLAPVARSVPSSEISSVQLARPWNLQLFGLSTVTISAQGSSASALVMHGLPAAEAERLVRQISELDEGGDHPGPEGSGTASSPSTENRDGPTPSDTSDEADRSQRTHDAAKGAMLYRSSPRDLVATMLSQGMVVGTMLAVLGAFSDIGDAVDVDVWRSPAGRAAIIVVIVAAGSVLSAARLHGLTIVAQGQHRYRIQYGRLDRVEHEVRRADVVSVSLITTPVDLLLGTVRVGLSTARLDETAGGQVRFPSMSEEDARRVLAALTGIERPPARRSAAVLLTPVLVVTLGGLATLSPGVTWVRLALGLAVAVVTTGVLRYLTCRVGIAANGSSLWCSSRGLAETITYCTAGWVQAATIRRVPLLPYRHLVVFGYAHRRQTLRAPVRSCAAFVRIGLFLDRRSAAPHWAAAATTGVTP